MEFKSTLKKKEEEFKGNAKRLRDAGIPIPSSVITINEIVRKSPKFLYTLNYAIDNAKTIQPSIEQEDLRIAVVLQLALCSQLIHHLIEDNILKIVE